MDEFIKTARSQEADVKAKLAVKKTVYATALNEQIQAAKKNRKDYQQIQAFGDKASQLEYAQYEEKLKQELQRALSMQ